MNIALTGKTRYRSTWRGKLVLQVEERWSDDSYDCGPLTNGTTWRDALTQDLAELEIKQSLVKPKTLVTTIATSARAVKLDVGLNSETSTGGS